MLAAAARRAVRSQAAPSGEAGLTLLARGLSSSAPSLKEEEPPGHPGTIDFGERMSPGSAQSSPAAAAVCRRCRLPPAVPTSSCLRSPLAAGFQHVPREEKETLVGEVFTSVSSSYDVMNDLMSGGCVCMNESQWRSLRLLVLDRLLATGLTCYNRGESCAVHSPTGPALSP